MTVETASSPVVRQRGFTTRRSVIIADRVADWTIRIGGIGVIAAVAAIMVFLFAVVLPLFGGGRTTDMVSHALPDAGQHGRAMFDRMDEYRTLAVAVAQDGTVSAVHIATGTPISAPAFDFGSAKVTAFSGALNGRDLGFGLDDGTVRIGRLVIDVKVVGPADLPAGLKSLAGGDQTDGQAVFSKLPGDQYRRVTVATTLEPAVQIAQGQAITNLDLRVGGTVERPTQTFVSLDASGQLRLSTTVARKNIMTGKTTLSAVSTDLPALPADVKINRLLVNDKGDQVYATSGDGRVLRYDTRDPKQPTLAEVMRPFPAGVSITAFSFLIGEQSLVLAGSDGEVQIYFRLQRDGAGTSDGRVLTRVHELGRQPAAIVAVAASQRGRLFATADAKGGVWLRHSTSDRVLLKLDVPADGGTITALDLAPREDGILAVTDRGRYFAWGIDVPHPETTLSSIFGKVWYEGYDQPGYTWQSSSGTDSFEPKFSLVPLVFGTIKAAFYSLLFAIPIAVGAAIFTSQFLHPKVRAVIKPIVEMMASLPSVVLGFLAALVIAPLVETWISAVLFGFFTLPLCLFIGAYLWQLLPINLQMMYGGVAKFALMFLALGVGIWAAGSGSLLFDNLMFAGDFSAWAAGQRGNDAAFTALLILPAAAIAAGIIVDRLAGARFSQLERQSRDRAGFIDLGRWLIVLAVALAIAALLGYLLSAQGWGVRGGVVSTYVQRNTLVVGFAMAFAVIPIIYTIAEDALNAVPEHLRGASLACGASPWQTALWVILPAALSGVFAAAMVGMGRAVGETMIVVMAAGNTPIMDWNLFNGLRALSANIAVELPEAVKDSTLYRMLFLAALSLFVLTFVINTAAEIVRQRFRKRTAQL